MLLKLKAFYLPFTETQAESLKKPKEDEEVRENKEYLNELKHYVLDNAKLTDDVKEKIENSVLNDNKEDFDMNKIAKYLSDNLDDANSKTTIVAWQIILKKHGLYKGNIDWINGPLTKKAIDEFKEKSLKDNENKIDVNSEFNKALISLINSGSLENKAKEGEKDKNWDNRGEGEKSKEDRNTLGEEDFKNYFEWENFQQRNVGDCRLLAAVDSLVSFWGYEDLIRSSVKIEGEKFIIKLPLWDKNWKEYEVPFEKLQTEQKTIEGNTSILVDWKLWVKELIYAYWKMTTWQDTFDNFNLHWGYSGDVFKDLISNENMHTYCAERTISVEEQKSDTDWKKDKNFVNNLLTVLKSFDSKNDMLVLSVNQSKETNNDRKDQSKDDYDNLWAYYEGTNHTISVEKVITDDQENPTIVVSNPWDSGRVYNIKFNELIKKSNAFQLCTKEERNLTQYRWKGNGEWVRRDAASSNIDKVDEAKTVNQIVEITWDVNEKLREARGDIIVENIWENKITVKSYNQTRQVEQSKWKIIIWSWDKKLSIPESEISDTFWEESNSIYRLYLYWAKIANMINFIENKYDKNDDFYLNKEWILQYDRVWPINTDILKDRSQLWISKNKTKKDFVNYLWTLWYKCKIALK